MKRVYLLLWLFPLLFSCGGEKGGGSLAPVAGAFGVILSGFQDSVSGSSFLPNSVSQISVLDNKPIYRVPSRVNILFISTKGLKPETITLSNILLLNLTNNTEVDRKIELGNSGKDFTVTPLTPLESGMVYLVKITTDVIDIEGNKLQEPVEVQIKTAGVLSEIQLAVTLPLLANRDPKVVLNEVIIDPKDNQSQWVELYNATDQMMNVQGWKIKLSEQVLYEIGSEGEKLNGGEFLVIRNLAQAIPKNNADLVLEDSLGVLVDRLTVSDGSSQGKDQEAITRTTNGISKGASDFVRSFATPQEAYFGADILTGESVFIKVIGRDLDGFKVPVSAVTFSGLNASDGVVTNLGQQLFLLKTLKTGTLTLIANSGSLNSQARITTRLGALSSFTLSAFPSPLISDGQTQSLITSSAITNSEGVLITDQSGIFFTIASSLGTILTSDQDTSKDGIQIKPNAESMLSFQLKSNVNDTIDSTSTVTVTSNDGQTTLLALPFSKAPSQGQPGMPSGSIDFEGSYTLVGDGVSTMTIISQPVKDGNNRAVEAGKQFDIYSPERSIFIDSFQDVNLMREGIQIQTDANGSLSVVIRAPYLTKRTEAIVRLNSVLGQGNANGEFSVVLTPPAGSGGGGGVITQCDGFEKLLFPGRETHLYTEKQCNEDAPDILLVAKDMPAGCATRFNDLQNAIDAVPTNLRSPRIIEVQDNGTYVLNHVIQKTTADQNASLIIRARPTFSPKINGPGGNRPAGFGINMSNLIIHGFTFQTQGIWQGIQIGENSHNIKIQNNVFTGTMPRGISIDHVNGGKIEVLNNCFDSPGTGVFIYEGDHGIRSFKNNVFQNIPIAFVLPLDGKSTSTFEITGNVVLSFANGGGRFYHYGKSIGRQELIDILKGVGQFGRVINSDNNVLHYNVYHYGTTDTYEDSDMMFVTYTSTVTNMFTKDDWINEVGKDVHSQFIRHVIER